MSLTNLVRLRNLLVVLWFASALVVIAPTVRAFVLSFQVWMWQNAGAVVVLVGLSVFVVTCHMLGDE